MAQGSIGRRPSDNRRPGAISRGPSPATGPGRPSPIGGYAGSSGIKPGPSRPVNGSGGITSGPGRGIATTSGTAKAPLPVQSKTARFAGKSGTPPANPPKRNLGATGGARFSTPNLGMEGAGKSALKKTTKPVKVAGPSARARQVANANASFKRTTAPGKSKGKAKRRTHRS